MNERIAVAGACLMDACFEASFEAGWWKTPMGFDLLWEVRNSTRFGKALIAEKLALIHSEISEGLEGLRKNLADDHLPHRTMLEVELADAIIRICDLAGALEFNLGNAIAEKMAYNAIRPDHKLENRATVGGKES